MKVTRFSRFTALAFGLALSVLTLSASPAPQASAPAAKQHFLVFLRPVSPSVMQNPKTPQILQQHFEYLKGQFAAGTLVLTGPLVDGQYGIGILETSSQEEAQRIMENDPSVKSGIFQLEIHQVRLPLLRGQSAPAASSQALSPAERTRLLNHLDATRKAVLDATAGLSDAQWNFKPGPDRWSVAEVSEHLALAEGFLFTLITQQVMKAPAPTDRKESAAEIDALILAVIPDRTNKAQAPGPLVPNGRWSPADALKNFQEGRATTLKFAKETPDLREHAIDSAIFNKKIDAYQWLLFISAHCERHTAQIKEVKSDPNFPKQ